MRTLVDTNILLRMISTGHPAQVTALAALDRLRELGDELSIAPQNLYEFWVVATRSTIQNGLGMSASDALLELSRLKALFVLLADRPDILQEWERLVSVQQIIGKNGHDARLVASMNVHGVLRLLTFNDKDFQRFSNIEVLLPDAILKSAETRSES
jgi:predicted nucleic acid-binding protein